MKKLFTRICMLCAVVALFSTSVLAKDGVFSTNRLKSDNILKEFGYDSNVLLEMSYEDKNEIAESILKNPDKIEMTCAYLNVNNIELFEYYTNTKDDVLIAQGLKAEEIKKIRNSMDKIKLLTEEQFVNQFNSSKAEYILIMKSLEKNPNYKNKKRGNRKVTTSGTIATSTMTYSMTSLNKSTSAAPSYAITITYNWLKPYFTDVFDDSIALAWGGGLNSKSVSSAANYYEGNYYTNRYGAIKQTVAWSKNETAQVGIVFTTPQSKKSATQQNKTGTIKATLYQTKYQGFDTKVLSQFGHKVLALSGGSISVGTDRVGVASINVTTNYDTSTQKSITVRY